MNRTSAISISNFLIEPTTLYAAITYAYLAAFIVVGIIYQPSLLLYALITLSAAIFIIPYPTIGLGAIVIMTMWFERFFTLQSLVIDNQTYKLYPLDIVVGLTIIGIVIGALRHRHWPSINWQICDRILLLFIIYTSYKFIVSTITPGADFSIAFSSFKNYAIYPVLYFLVLILLRHRENWTNMIRTMIGAGVGIIAFIIIGLALGEGLWTEYTPLSTSGVRLLAGTHAFYLIVISMITISMIAEYSRRWRVVMIGLLMVWLVGIVGSLMRHLWVAMAVGGAAILTMVADHERHRLVRYGAQAVLVVIMLATIIFWLTSLFPNTAFQATLDQVADNTFSRVGSVSDLSVDTSATWRVMVWQVAFERWLENPAFGVGFGQAITIGGTDWQTNEFIRNIHNSPLAIAVQTGLVGIGLLVLWLYTIFNYGFQTLRNHRDYTLIAGLIAALAVLIFSSLFQPYLETNLTGIFLWIIAGLIRVVGETANNDSPFTETPNTKL